MRILALDDEKIALEALVDAIEKALSVEASISSFRRLDEARAFIQENEVDVAFLDINIRKGSGIEFAQEIKLLYPNANIIFCTGYSEYMPMAFSMHASGYLNKPISAQDIKNELENLRHPVENTNTSKLTIKAFGNFEVTYNGKVVEFERKKTNEVLAYLIDRGTVCTKSEIMASIFEDDKSRYLSYLIKDLESTLKKLGCEEAVERGHGTLRINKDEVICDFYLFLEGKPEGINAYRGEYMSQYSWAEFTNAMLMRKTEITNY